MISPIRKSFLLSTVVAYFALDYTSTTITTSAFVASPTASPISRFHTSSTSSLFAKVAPDGSDKSRNNDKSRRRDVFKAFRRVVFGAGAMSTMSKFANAEPTPGRVVQFEIANVDGEIGKTGVVKIQLYPDWAPRGVQRFEDLTEQKFWDNVRIFRVIPGFIAQFGINGNPDVQANWRSRSIPDDPVKVSNDRGTVVFATAGPNTRTTQIFINTRAQGNAFLDRQGFSPIGKVIEGMDIVDAFYSEYGEGAPQGKGPNQGLIQKAGNEYLEKGYPKLSYIAKASFAE